jgi:hypothetical protein
VVGSDLARLPAAEWLGVPVTATITDGVVRYANGIG